MSALAMQSAPSSGRRKSCWLGTPEIYFRKTIDNSRLVKLEDPRRAREMKQFSFALCCLFLSSCGRMVKPGGLLFLSTLNRTAKAWALAIAGGEYLLGWLPRGTHDWNRFVRPSEFVLGLRRHGFTATRLAGLTYEWRRGEWAEADDLSVNYMVAALRR